VTPGAGALGTAARTARRTLSGAARIAGRGLFTGALAELTIRASESAGVVFRRVDVPGSPPIPALAAHVGSDPRLPGRNTILMLNPARATGPDNPGVLTVEHVMSALAGLGITDAMVEVAGPEVPIDDGSAAALVNAIAAAGTRELGTPAEPIVVRERLVVRDAKGIGEIVAEPLNGTRSELSYTLDYGAGGAGSGLARQTFAWTVDPVTYARDVAPARTFCLQREAEAMRAAGLFSWITPRDMLVLADDGRPIDNELRFPDEPARHKLLDLLGDLSLAGAPFIGRIAATRSGHALNAEMARALRRHAGL